MMPKPLLFLSVLMMVACDPDDTKSDCANTVFFADADGDGFGNIDDTTTACEQPSGYVSDSTDCDDSNAAASPGGAEVCDGVDNDCNDSIDDDASDAQAWYLDEDGDGFGRQDDAVVACEQPSSYVDDGADCDDSAADINPDADEVCDKVDNNCDGSVDESTATDASVWYADLDADGYGDAKNTAAACEQPSGYVDETTDCDDDDDQVYPGAEEICDAKDSDCDGTIGEGLVPSVYSTIDDAIYNGPDLICVEAGTHLEPLVFDSIGPVTIEGAGGSGAVTLDADGGRAITIIDSLYISITGITITNASVSDGLGGAAIMVENSQLITLEDIVVHDVSCEGECTGAAIGFTDSEELFLTDITAYNVASSDTESTNHTGIIGFDSSIIVEIDGMEIYDSTVSQAGAVWGGGFAFLDGGALAINDLSVHDLSVQGNIIYGTGAMAYSASSLDLANVSVSGVDGTGNSIVAPYFVYETTSDVSTTNLSVVGNTSSAPKGLVYAGGMWNHNTGRDATYTNVIVAGNTTTATISYASGLWETSTIGSAQYTNVTVHGNDNDTSGVYAGEGAFSCFSSSLRVTNATVTGNTLGGTATGDGKTIAGGWSDTWSQGTPCTWDVSYSNVYGNSGDAFGDGMTDWTGTDGNIAVDAAYTDASGADPTTWDLTLGSKSPLIDAGDPSILDPDKTTSDIGAYGGPSGDAW